MSDSVAELARFFDGTCRNSTLPFETCAAPLGSDYRREATVAHSAQPFHRPLFRLARA